MRIENNTSRPRNTRILPLLVLDHDKEQVENLDSWIVNKGIILSPNINSQYRNKIAGKISGYNLAVMAKNSKKSLPRIETLLKEKTFICEEGKRKGTLGLHDKNYATNQGIDCENPMKHKYQYLILKIKKKKERLTKLSKERDGISSEISQMKLYICQVKEGKAGRSSTQHKRSMSILVSKFTEASLIYMKNKQLEELNSKLLDLSNKKLEIEEKTNLVCEKLKSLKAELAILKENRNEYYHRLLYEGIDSRNDGLSWIIKAIWSIGKKVNLSKLPPYLDAKGIEYIFKVTSVLKQS